MSEQEVRFCYKIKIVYPGIWDPLVGGGLEEEEPEPGQITYSVETAI